MENDYDYGARVRAAQRFAGIDPEELAAGIGISRRTLDRITTSERPLTVAEAHAIAKLCGVPLTFLTEGWRAARTTEDRLRSVEEQLDGISGRLADLEQAVQRLLAELVVREREASPRTGGADRPEGRTRPSRPA